MKKHLFFVLAILLLVFPLMATEVHAQTKLPTKVSEAAKQDLDKLENNDADDIEADMPTSIFTQGQFGTRLKQCAETPPIGISSAAWKEKLSARFTYCMRQLLGEGTERILDELSDYMRPAMYAIILLATIIMGMKAVGGMFRNTKAESVVFFTRVAIVIVAFEHMAEISALFFDITDTVLVLLGDGAAATFNATGSGGFQCKTTLATTIYPNYKWVQIYDWLDCLFQKLYGMASSEPLKNGFLAIAGASFFSGTMGAHLGMVFIGFFVALGLFLLRVTGMLVMAYGALALMMMVLPIFMLTVFFKVTENYFFQRWMSMVVRNMVQPAIVIGFLYFGVAALDILIFKGSEKYYFKYDHTTSSINPLNTPAQNKNKHGFMNRPDLREVGGLYSLAQLQALGYSPVVEPIFDIFNVNPLTDTDQEVAQKVTRLVPKHEPLYEFEYNTDSGLYNMVEAKCGDYGVWGGVGAGLGLALEGLYNVAKSSLPTLLPKVTADPADVQQDIENGVTSTDPKTQERIFKLLCGLGKAGAEWDFLRENLEENVNSAIPDVPVLDFTKLAQEEGMGDKIPEFSRITLGKILVALFALIVLGSTLYSFTNSIDKIARTMIGRMSMNLSITGDNPGGWSLNKIATKGLDTMEDGWKKMVDKPKQDYRR